MLARLRGSTNQIDLTQTKFDAVNPEHVAALKARIDSFNDAVWALMKTDIRIVVPVTASLLLWLNGICGTIVELMLLAGCAATLWASNTLSQRVAQSAVCQEKLHELLCIYKKCIADHGYQITANESIFNLLKTIAPYVETHQLWTVSVDNPKDYPGGFKKILSTEPHRVPFNETKTDASNMFITTVAAFTGISSAVPAASQAVIQQHAGGMMKLFHRVTADTRQTVYGYDEKERVTNNIR